MHDLDKPDFIVLVGLPASGKSTFAESISLNYKHFECPCIVHSSDAIRKELWGSEEDQQHPEIVFEEMRQRLKHRATLVLRKVGFVDDRRSAASSQSLIDTLLRGQVL